MSFVQWKNCWNEPKQLLKLIILLLCVCFSLYQFLQCVNKLLNPPMSTHSRFYLNETMKYPSLTICRRPGYKTSLFTKYGLRIGTDMESVRAFQNFNFEEYTVKEFLEEVTYTFDEVFKSYAYAGTGNSVPVQPSIETSSFFSIAYGRCYTMAATKPSDTFSVSGGYFLYLVHDVVSKKLDSFGISESGFAIFLHDSNEILTSAKEQENSFLEYLYLESGEDMRVTLGVQEFSSLSSKGWQCISDDPDYSKSKCQERCLHENIAADVQCTAPWLQLSSNHTYPLCSNATEMQAILSGILLTENRHSYTQNCSCLKTCNITVYSTHVINRKEMEVKNFSQISIYYTSNLVTKMSELISYDWNVFLADIGGSLGFLLGLSVIGFIALVEEICQIIFRRWFKKKRELVEEDNCSELKNNVLNEKNNEEVSFNSKNLDCGEENFINDLNTNVKQVNKY